MSLAGVAGLVSGGAGVAAAPPAAAAARAVVKGATGGLPGGSGPVLLITGAQARMVPGPGGRPVTELVPPSQPGGGLGAIMTMGPVGHTRQVPMEALPFLGRGLDPSLFDVSALRKLEHGGRLPVRVSYTGRVPSLPGVTITHADAGTAEGFVTARSAPAFGAALGAQFKADHDRAAYGTDGLFAHGVSISPAGAAAPHPVPPRFVMHTLTLHATDMAGQPDNGDSVFLVNADNTNRVAGDGVFRNGIAKVSVPAGHYWAVGLFFGTNKAGFVFPQEFELPASGPGPHVNIAGQSAKSVVSASTPRPAVRNSLEFTMDLHGHAGPPFILGLDVLGPLAQSVNFAVAPASYKPAVGSIRTFTQEQLTSTSKTGVPYAYSLDFPGPLNRVPSQHFVVRPASLATVHENYFQDKPTAGGWGTAGGSVPEVDAGLVVLPQPLHLPGQQIQYLTGGPSELWASLYVEFLSSFAGGQAGRLVSLRAGTQSTQDWGRYPLHPAPNVNLAHLTGSIQGFRLLPSAARAGDVLGLGMTAFSDSTPGHLGGGFLPDPGAKLTQRYEVDQNGTRLASGDATNGIAPVKLSPHPSVVRFKLTATRSGAHYVLSPTSTTAWTWRSRRAPAATVPAPWSCQAGTSATAGLTRQCAVQPMMTLGYQVAGLSPAGATAPGQQVIKLSAGHLQLAADPAVTRASLRVSFDDGKTWHPATVSVTGTRGQFSAAFTAPAGRFVTLQATAADAAGGSVTETITRAYQTAPATAAPAAGAPATVGAPAAIRAPAAGGTPPVFIKPRCATAQPRQAQCFLAYRPQAAVNQALAAGRAAQPAGLGPGAIRSAYRLPSQKSSDQTVAVSIAFHTPGLASFLAAYRKHYGLPPCTVASGCFRQVNQNGKASPAEPSGVGTGWDLEATLDVSMISVSCPHCHILVVEGKDPTVPNLAATDRTAARLGAQVISNSYGAGEDQFSLPFRKDYQLPGHTVVASSGDSGFTSPAFPADLPSVTAVGGTMLAKAANKRGWSERVWLQSFGAGGSGCSAWVAKPAWQHDTHCSMRTIADISAVASNIPVFNSTYGGWVTLAGTSVSAPLVAGIYGLAGNGTSMTTAKLYQRARSFFDITAGHNTFASAQQACGDDYMCAAKKGYDAPTGLGTPNGTGGL